MTPSIQTRSSLLGCLAFLGYVGVSGHANAYLEDICISTTTNVFDNCIDRNACDTGNATPNAACAAQILQAAQVQRGRSMIHMDATYFLAEALGYRSDVAYWIAAYSEVTDLAQYVPADQCSVQATTMNSGAKYITTKYNGLVRTNAATGGTSYHYINGFSPNGKGRDLFAVGVSGVYPFHAPSPGYPTVIDDVYEGTLFNLRTWTMRNDSVTTPTTGNFCTSGLTTPVSTNGASSNFGGATCASGVAFSGNVPAIGSAGPGVAANWTSGPMILDQTTDSNGRTVNHYMGELPGYLADKTKTTGTLYLDPTSTSVPVQVARIAHYLHAMQDRTSHSICGDDEPHEEAANDSGTYMALTTATTMNVAYGTLCAQQYHVEGHIQETGTGSVALPLRVYTGLNLTVDELIVFGNLVAKGNGWIANPELLPADSVSAKNGQGQSAADIKAATVGKISSGTAYSGSEQYVSGVVTLPLQQTSALGRIGAMNSALVAYSATLKSRSPNPSAFKALPPLPGNSGDATDTSVCFH